MTADNAQKTTGVDLGKNPSKTDSDEDAQIRLQNPAEKLRSCSLDLIAKTNKSTSNIYHFPSVIRPVLHKNMKIYMEMLHKGTGAARKS